VAYKTLWIMKYSLKPNLEAIVSTANTPAYLAHDPQNCKKTFYAGVLVYQFWRTKH